jgi:hypothetical protein
MRYTIIGLPASFSLADDVVVMDSCGAYGLLGRAPAWLTPLAHDDAGLVMSFYEPAEDMGWRTLNELALHLYGEPVRECAENAQSPTRGPDLGQTIASLRGRFRPVSRGFRRFPTAAKWYRRARRIASAKPQLPPSPHPFAPEAGHPTRLSPSPIRKGLDPHAGDLDPPRRH